jgi:hypothetical protein
MEWQPKPPVPPCGKSWGLIYKTLIATAALCVALALPYAFVTAPTTTSYCKVSALSMIDHARQGTKGRLFFSELDFSVALYECEESNWWIAQEIVDAEDSAVWFCWFGSESPIIADHCSQGFEVIKSCSVGSVCYIVDGDELRAYECVTVDPNAINARNDMFLSTGESFMKETDPGCLYMYTCNEVGDPYHITVVVWKEIDRS